MNIEPFAEELIRIFFTHADESLYAVLDGASVPDLPRKLWKERVEHDCLFRGELAPDLAHTAPYLAKLGPQQSFTRQLLHEGWGQHWGIFAVTKADSVIVRRHFRTFLMVQDEQNKRLYFRYYDPRVWRVYLPTCNAEETKTVFGPISVFFCEDENPGTVLSFRPAGGRVQKDSISFAGASS